MIATQNPQNADVRVAFFDAIKQLRLRGILGKKWPFENLIASTDPLPPLSLPHPMFVIFKPILIQIL